MCYNTRQSRKKAELRKWANAEALVGNITKNTLKIRKHLEG